MDTATHQAALIFYCLIFHGGSNKGHLNPLAFRNYRLRLEQRQQKSFLSSPETDIIQQISNIRPGEPLDCEHFSAYLSKKLSTSPLITQQDILRFHQRAIQLLQGNLQQPLQDIDTFWDATQYIPISKEQVHSTLSMYLGFINPDMSSQFVTLKNVLAFLVRNQEPELIESLIFIIKKKLVVNLLISLQESTLVCLQCLCYLLTLARTQPRVKRVLTQTQLAQVQHRQCILSYCCSQDLVIRAQALVAVSLMCLDSEVFAELISQPQSRKLILYDPSLRDHFVRFYSCWFRNLKPQGQREQGLALQMVKSILNQTNSNLIDSLGLNAIKSALPHLQKDPDAFSFLAQLPRYFSDKNWSKEVQEAGNRLFAESLHSRLNLCSNIFLISPNVSEFFTSVLVQPQNPNLRTVLSILMECTDSNLLSILIKQHGLIPKLFSLLDHVASLPLDVPSKISSILVNLVLGASEAQVLQLIQLGVIQRASFLATRVCVTPVVAKELYDTNLGLDPHIFINTFRLLYLCLVGQKPEVNHSQVDKFIQKVTPQDIDNLKQAFIDLVSPERETSTHLIIAILNQTIVGGACLSKTIHCLIIQLLLGMHFGNPVTYQKVIELKKCFQIFLRKYIKYSEIQALGISVELDMRLQLLSPDLDQALPRCCKIYCFSTAKTSFSRLKLILQKIANITFGRHSPSIQWLNPLTSRQEIVNSDQKYQSVLDFYLSDTKQRYPQIMLIIEQDKISNLLENQAIAADPRLATISAPSPMYASQRPPLVNTMVPPAAPLYATYAPPRMQQQQGSIDPRMTSSVVFRHPATVMNNVMGTSRHANSQCQMCLANRPLPPNSKFCESCLTSGRR